MRKLGYLVGLVMTVGGIAVLAAGTMIVTPRIYSTPDGVFCLFDNTTGAAQSGLVIVLRDAANIEASAVAAFGGGPITEIEQMGPRTVRIHVEIAAGGSLQVVLPVGTTIAWAWFMP